MYLNKDNQKQSFSIKFKAYFKGSKPLFLLINETFWKGMMGPFLAFIFPLFFITILGLMLGYDQVLAGSLGIPGMAVSLTSMPLFIFEFKNSSLLKRIGATPVKPSLFIIITFLFYMGIIFLAVLWCILFSLLLFGTQYWDTGRLITTRDITTTIEGIGTITISNVEVIALSFQQTLENVNWGSFIYGILISIAVGLSVGMFLVSTAKSASMIQTFGVTIMVLSMFLSAQVIPSGMAKQNDIIWYAGYVLSPFKGNTNYFLSSWNGNVNEGIYLYNGGSLSDLISSYVTTGQLPDSIVATPDVSISDPFDFNTSWWFFNFESTDRVEVLYPAEKIVSFVLPFFWIALFMAIAIKKFRWSIR